MRFFLAITIFIFCYLLSVTDVLVAQSLSTRGGGTQVISNSLSSFRNGVSSAMGNTSLSALYNELSFVNNIAQLPLSNQTGGVGLSYSPVLSGLPIQDSRWFQMSLEGYYVFGEDYYQPSTEKLAAIYECYKVSGSSLRDVRGRVLSLKKNGYVLRRQALSLKTSYYSRGRIIGTDVDGRSLGEVVPFDFSTAIGYSVNLFDNFSTGLALRYLQSTIYVPVQAASSPNSILEAQTANAFSADLYFFYDIPFKEHKRGGISIGMIIANLGTKIEFGNGLSGYQPAYIDLGASFTNIFSEEHAFHYTFDIKKSLVHSLPSSDLLTTENLKRYSSLSVDESLIKSFESFDNYTLNLGAQYVYKEMLFLRAGFELERTPFETVYRASTGLGFSYDNRFNLDFAYWIPFGSTMTNFSSSWSLSASIEF